MPSSGSDASDRPSVTLTPSGLGQYIGYSGCPRFFRLKFFDQDIVNERNWYDPNAHSDLFAELGLAYEERQLETLARTADQVIGDVETDGDPVDYDATWPASVETETGEERSDIETRWSHTIRDQLSGIVEDLAGRHPEDCDGPVVLFQTPMYGQIGVWDINGIADLIVLEPLPERRGVRSRVGGTTALIGGR